MSIPELEIAVSNAADALDSNNLSSYELKQNFDKFKKDSSDTEAFEYIKALVISPRGLQDLVLENISRDCWLDLIDAIYDALEIQNERNT